LATIFISYRRGDAGWAGRLHDALEVDFPVFMDTSDIPPGENWSDQILNELIDCRILVVAIGKHWLRNVNLKRLFDSKDWVRRELIAAQRRAPSIRMVPVLVDGATRPDTAQLPPELRFLNDLQVCTLLPDNWEVGVRDLSVKFRGWLAGRASSVPSTRPFPRVLPYLCDRVDQEEELGELISEAHGRKPLSILLHGPRVEAHFGFIDRLIHMHILDDLMSAQMTGVAVHQLDWRFDQAQLGQFSTILRRAIKRRAMLSPNAGEGELRQYLRVRRQPTILVMEVSMEEREACSGDLLRSFSEAWLDLFKNPDLSPETPIGLWVNFSYPTDDAPPGVVEMPGALPRLQPIRDRHIAEWIALADVQMHLGDRVPRLLALPARWRRPDGSLHMLNFVEAVEHVRTTP
jgi:hypothetical protein